MAAERGNIADTKDFPGSGKTLTVVIALIVVVAGLLRFTTLSLESLWFDELYVVWARSISLGDMFPEILASEHPPVFNVVGHFWQYLGTGEIWVRSLSALLGTATVILAYLTARELLSPRAALWAAAFCAASPMLVWYSRDATSYSWVIAISLASLYLLTRSCLRGGRGNWSAYVIVTAVAIFSHLLSGVLLVAEAVFFLILREKGKASVKPWLISQLILLSILVLMLVYGMSYGNPLRAADPVSLNTVSRFLFGSANALYLSLLGYKDQAYYSPAAAPYLERGKLLLLVMTLVAISIPFISRQVRRIFISKRTAALATFALILLTGPVALLLLRDTPATGRYYVWAVPAVMMLLAAVVSRAPRKIGAAAGAMIVAGLLLATVHDFSIDHNDDWRGLMSVIADQRQAGDMLLCFPAHNCVVAADFYLDEEIYVYGGLVSLNNRDKVFFGPAGESWHGYLDGYQTDGEDVFLDKDAIGPRLEDELDGRDRFWYIAGAGVVNHYLDAPLVEEALSNSGWRVALVYETGIITMKLYERG